MNQSYSGFTAAKVADASMPRKVARGQRAILEEIGRRIAAARKAKDITQVELAKRLGVSQGNVSGYERGTLRIPCDQLLAIAQALRVSADELLGLARPAAHRERATGTPRLRRRLELLEALPKRDQDALSRLLAAFETRLGVVKHSRNSHTDAR